MQGVGDLLVVGRGMFGVLERDAEGTMPSRAQNYIVDWDLTTGFKPLKQLSNDSCDEEHIKPVANIGSC